MAQAATLPPAERLTREQLAERVKELLTDEPKSGAAIRRELDQLGMRGGATGKGQITEVLRMLESYGDAKRVTHRGREAWVHERSELEARVVAAQQFELPYRPEVIQFDEMFVDLDYQRPLTSFAEKVEREFDPFLMQALVVNDRAAWAREEGKREPAKDKRFALIDGQTRRYGAMRRGVPGWLCIVLDGISPAREAELFARFQKERRGVLSIYRFRAQLRYDPDSQALDRLVREAGYQIGPREKGQLSAVTVLEQCYRADDFLLLRTLGNLHAAFGEVDLPAVLIKGLHYWFRNPKHRFRKKDVEVDDPRLARRLNTAGIEQLKRRASAAREFGQGQNGSSSKGGYIWMAQAIDAIYKSGR